MAAPLSRLRCLLRQAQVLLLFLGIAYLMAGSILLLQRSSIRVPQAGLGSLPPLLALPAPPTVPRAPALGIRAQRSRWEASQGTSVVGVRTGHPWPAGARNAGVRRLHRRWFHGLSPESQEQRSALQRSRRHKGRNLQTGRSQSLWFSGTTGRSWLKSFCVCLCFGVVKGTYVGCFLHEAGQRALGGTLLYDTRKMTSSLCQDTCSESGYRYAGLEYGSECHCGNQINSRAAAEEECSLACRGERASPCGGVGRLSVYKVEEQIPGHRKFRNVRYIGCFKIPKNTTDAFPVRSLQPNLTSQACIESCTDKEFPLAVMQTPRCFCAWAATLLSLGQALDETPCERAGSLNATAAAQPGHDYYYQVHQTPVLDSRCRERMFLPQRSRPLVALSSFPGAGNTWVRHLIELVTGYYTGSFYFDGTLYNQGFKGEKDYWKSGRSICVKTHESGQREIEMFDAAILLIRNPYRSLVAEFNRKCAGHLGYASEAQWRSKEWPDFVDSYAPWWASHALSWLKYGRSLLVVHYEDLQRALFPQVRLISAFLNASVTDERLVCARSNQEGHFKRSGVQKPPFDPFSPEMRSAIDSYIRSVDQALRGRNMSGLPHEYIPR